GCTAVPAVAREGEVAGVAPDFRLVLPLDQERQPRVCLRDLERLPEHVGVGAIFVSNRLVLLLHRSVPRLLADRRHLLVAHVPVSVAPRAIMLPTGRESAGFRSCRS